MHRQAHERLEAKTRERRFLQALEQDFHYAPRIAEAILAEAEACLLGHAEQLRPGQVRAILAQYDAGHGRALRDTETTEVTWTVDAEREDRQVLRQHGHVALRRVRIQRLLDEVPVGQACPELSRRVGGGSNEGSTRLCELHIRRFCLDR